MITANPKGTMSGKQPYRLQLLFNHILCSTCRGYDQKNDVLSNVFIENKIAINIY